MRPNEIIHFDYLFLGNTSNSNNQFKYVLVIEDDLSGYCWLDPSPSATAEHVAEVLSRWHRVFSSPRMWVSDQGSHFKNEVLQSLARTHNVRHHLTVAYSPWSNGTVESLMRSILSATRVMLGELKLAPTDWDSVIPAIATALNSSSSDRLGRRPSGVSRTPLEVMTGIIPNRPILQIIPSRMSAFTEKNISLAQALKILNINDLQLKFNNMHKNVSTITNLRRQNAVKAHNEATNIISPSFTVGDFVLIRKATHRGHKLQFRWSGPRRITAVHSELVYSVQPLRGGRTERIHCTRMIPYEDNLLGSKVPQDVLDLADQSESKYEIVEKIWDVGKEQDNLFLRVQWDGLPDKRDWTWHSLEDLYTDIPDMVREFLNTFNRKKNLITKCKRRLRL